MRYLFWLRNIFQMLLSSILIIQLAGCGTLLYPERKGQRGGSIDIGIAILDGIGLLFCVIPGLIAYGVDFTTGAIYLPGGRHSSGSADGVRMVAVDPAKLNEKNIEAIVARETGIPAETLAKNRPETYAVKSTDEMVAKIAQSNR